MGDFAGGLLKYLRHHPLPRLTIAGGFGKMAKLAQGNLDLHSGRSQVDQAWLADRLAELGAENATIAKVREAHSALETLALAQQSALPLADLVAARARTSALAVLADAPVAVEVMIFDREGALIGRSEG